MVDLTGSPEWTGASLGSGIYSSIFSGNGSELSSGSPGSLRGYWAGEESSEAMVRITQGRIQLANLARERKVDYILGAKASVKEGQVYLTPTLYAKDSDLFLQAPTIPIREMDLYTDLYSGLNSSLRLIEKNSRKTGIPVQIEPLPMEKENWIPSSDSVLRYFQYLHEVGSSRQNSQKLILTPDKWEEIAKREPIFWQPWEKYILLRFSGREESYDTLYFLENLSKKGSKYFALPLAEMALRFGEVCLEKKNKYSAIRLLEFSLQGFQSSGRTLGLSYANLLYQFSIYHDLDKNSDLSFLYLQNAFLAFQELDQLDSKAGIEIRYKLARMYQDRAQSGLALQLLNRLVAEKYRSSEVLSDSDLYSKAIALYNVSVLNLELGRLRESESYLQETIHVLKSGGLGSTDLMVRARINLSAIFAKRKEWNRLIQNSLQLELDLKILGWENSESDTKNSYNLALGYLHKNAQETAKSWMDRYSKYTPYSKLRPLSLESDPEFYGFEYSSDQQLPGVFTESEISLIRSFSGKYKISAQTQDIRARTYSDRLEDHDIFLSELLGQAPSRSPEMQALRELFGFASRKGLKLGKDSIFIDIGPALGNANQPAVTSLSLADRFPEMQMVLLELPEEVDFFFKKTEAKAREEVLARQNVRILAADGVERLKNHFISKKGWALSDRSIPKLSNKFIIIRAANSIDIYEPFSKIEPYLTGLAKDYAKENILLFWNRTIFAKPAGVERFRLIGSQSIRGFYHNSQSLDRQGEPPFVLSGLNLRKGE